MKALGLVSLLVTLAIIAYLIAGNKETGQLAQAQAGHEMRQKAEAAVVQANVAQVKLLVQSFKAQKERLPASLEELKDAGLLNEVPAGLSYDPATGEVSAAP